MDARSYAFSMIGNTSHLRLFVDDRAVVAIATAIIELSEASAYVCLIRIALIEFVVASM